MKVLSIKKYVKWERNARYNNLRKVRKARDMASAATKNKTAPWKMSRVLLRFHADINRSTTKGLARLIYHYMPIHLQPPPRPPLVKG